MNVEELKRSLNYTKKKHQDDRLFTGQTNIAVMCEDVLNTIFHIRVTIRIYCWNGTWMEARKNC